jgi:hypothetical protein
MDAVRRADRGAARRAFSFADRNLLDLYLIARKTESSERVAGALRPDPGAAAQNRALALANRPAMTPGRIVYEIFGPGTQPGEIRGAAIAWPTLAAAPGVARKLQSDFLEQFGDGFARLPNAIVAAEYARRAIPKKWSATNAASTRNALMAHPPERYYPRRQRGYGYIAAQLANLVRDRAPDAAAFGLLPVSGQTIAEIEAGEPPCYRVWYRDPTGASHILCDAHTRRPALIRFNPDAATAKAARGPAARTGGKGTSAAGSPSPTRTPRKPPRASG